MNASRHPCGADDASGVNAWGNKCGLLHKFSSSSDFCCSWSFSLPTNSRSLARLAPNTVSRPPKPLLLTRSNSRVLVRISAKMSSAGRFILAGFVTSPAGTDFSRVERCGHQTRNVSMSCSSVRLASPAAPLRLRSNFLVYCPLIK